MGDLSGDDVARIENAAFVYVRQMMDERRYLGWLVERESAAIAGAGHGEVVAGAGIVISQLLPRPGAVEGGAQALIVNVYCEPDHRRRGLARALITAILDWCKLARMAKVVLHASPDGQPLYESLGFVQTNEMRWQGPIES
ncbi:MAG: GNAT family N-acetyltransferase, partial [Chloracidobacterium sp.]|nr:GNAT family N-acetyltransferase [Chloracidobacterium sp.]